MKSKITSALLVFAFVIPGGMTVGQQPQQRDVSITQLQGIIEKLEVVERDPNTPLSFDPSTENKSL